MSEMPKVCWSLVRRIVWSMVSKAAERSRSVRRETLPESVCKEEVVENVEQGCFSTMRLAVG